MICTNMAQTKTFVDFSSKNESTINCNTSFVLDRVLSHIGRTQRYCENTNMPHALAIPITHPWLDTTWTSMFSNPSIWNWPRPSFYMKSWQTRDCSPNCRPSNTQTVWLPDKGLDSENDWRLDTKGLWVRWGFSLHYISSSPSQKNKTNKNQTLITSHTSLWTTTAPCRL